MAEKSVARSTRHHVTDERFADLLAEDFGISPFAAYSLRGVPKKAAIAVAQWAQSNIADTEERGEAVRAWAKKRGVGQFDRRLIGQPAPTFDGREPEGV